LKKYLVLGILFILPITVYLFFASGVNQFAKLPKLGDQIIVLNAFEGENGAALTTEGKITILGFLGQNALEHKAEVFNLAHKIYKKELSVRGLSNVISDHQRSGLCCGLLKARIFADCRSD